jgi:hypothetical protein
VSSVIALSGIYLTTSQHEPARLHISYDNCPRQEAWLQKHGKTTRWLLNALRRKMGSAINSTDVDDDLTNAAANDALLESAVTKSGGYAWSCGGMDAASAWFQTAAVQKAMHLNAPDQSDFHYARSGPASITLYPELIKKLRILIYNGDADSCVPYKGNEEWITDLETQGLLKEDTPWRPWCVKLLAVD